MVFKTEDGDPIEVFTTRPDTLWGATFMVLAPEHPLVDKLTTPEQHESVHEYIHEAVRQTDIEREALDKEKTGVFTGGYAINPVNDERIPVWIADYVLMTYGTRGHSPCMWAEGLLHAWGGVRVIKKTCYGYACLLPRRPAHGSLLR